MRRWGYKASPKAGSYSLDYFTLSQTLAQYQTLFTMVKLEAVRALNVSLVQSQPLVAVFFGGTSKIGLSTLRALANAAAKGRKGLRAYVVGRHADAANDILSGCRDTYPDGVFRFVKANDLSLIRDVDRVCAEILQAEEKEGPDARIDYLMMTQGGPIFQPRKGTC